MLSEEMGGISRKHIILKRIAKVFALLVIAFICLVLFIRSPWGQHIIVTKAIAYISDKTGTTVEIDKLFITFSGDVQLNGLYLEDQKGDTLLYSRSLKADIALSPLIFGNTFSLDAADWYGVTAKINRDRDTEKFNFDFLLEAFVSENTPTSPEASEPFAIDIGTVTLNDFSIDYNDAYLGIDSKIILGKLFLDADNLDLESMQFALDDLEIYDSRFTYRQIKPALPDQDSTATQLPYVSVHKLKLENVTTDYKSVPDHIVANIKIGDFELGLPRADLASNDYKIEYITLKDSEVFLKMNEQRTLSQDSVPDTREINFIWPAYTIAVAKIDMDNNSLSYRLGNQKPVKGAFNPDAMTVTDLKIKAKDLHYAPKHVNLKVTEFSFLEKSGFGLRNMAFEYVLEDTSMALTNLSVLTDNSTMKGSMLLEYPTTEKLISTPEKVMVDVDLPQIKLVLEDAFFFQPTLASNEYLKIASQDTFTGQLFIKGTLDAMNIQNTRINWGKNTYLMAEGILNNGTEIDSLSFNFKDIKARTVHSDISLFVSKEDLGMSVPSNVSIEASARGSLESFSTDVFLKIPEGAVQLIGDISFKKDFAFDGRLEIDSLQLNRLLENPTLGQLSLIANGAVSGKGPNTLNADFTSNISRFQWNGYDYTNLSATGKINKGEGDVVLKYKDDNLNFTSEAMVLMDTTAYDIQVAIDLVGADLNAMNLASNNIKVGAKFKADFLGTVQDFQLNTTLSEGIAVLDDEQYQTEDIKFKANIDENTTQIEVTSGFLNGQLDSNSSPMGIGVALRKQFRTYFSDELQTESVVDSVRIKMNARLTPVPLLTEVFLKGVQRLDTIAVNANFDASSKVLQAELSIPSIVYKNSVLDSVNLRIDGDSTNLNFSSGFAGLKYDPVNIKKTYVQGNLKNKELLLDFVSYDDDEKLLHLASEMRSKNDTLELHIDPSELIFNKKKWTIPNDNLIAIAKEHLHFENVILSRNEQELKLTNTVSGVKENHFGLIFENFKLQTFLSFINPDEALASGLVNGNLILENPYGATGIVADFKINELTLLESLLGNLSLEASSKGVSEYNFDMSIKDGGIDLDLTGEYTATQQGAGLDMYLDLKKLETKVIQGFFPEEIAQPKGYLSGQLELAGTTANPIYEGQISFHKTALEVIPLNANFKIDNETIDIDQTKVVLNDFDIQDGNKGSFTIDGSIATKTLTNPEFDLRLQAEEFRLLNSAEKDNELYYGTMSVDADIDIKGDSKLPKISGKTRIRKVTDLTYVVPEEQLDIQERDGVVIFVNRENPDAILTRNEGEQAPNNLRGFDIDMVVEIAEDAIFTIVLDERTNDRLQVAGDATLSLNLDPNGTIGINGRYELSEGFYRTSLYNLVTRKFDIKPRSTITWRGDPLDAKLDVTAIYQVETSAAPLMASATSGVEAGLASKYQQVMPFLVYLNVEGEIMEPELSFDLEIPEESRGDLGGGVYGKVQQLNEQETELNKQVFSLLAFNRFFPNTGSDGSSGGTASLARNNVNKVLSGELNAFSEKVFGNSGFEVGFDLDSFTDYRGETAQDRTQLNINAKKKLFNNRLIVTAGSAVDVEGSAQAGQDETPIIGNVSLEYLLTENGRYRLKGFRKSEFANVIDGQLIITGLALIFNREFNEFSELFSPLKNEQKTNAKKTNKKTPKKTVNE
ncbi:MAG: translocation/assembly module TamB domain-containing protein [Saonia sp.]